jgi:hypothetical protein
VAPPFADSFLHHHPLNRLLLAGVAAGFTAEVTAEVTAGVTPGGGGVTPA